MHIWVHKKLNIHHVYVITISLLPRIAHFPGVHAAHLITFRDRPDPPGGGGALTYGSDDDVRDTAPKVGVFRCRLNKEKRGSFSEGKRKTGGSFGEDYKKGGLLANKDQFQNFSGHPEISVIFTMFTMIWSNFFENLTHV